VKVIKIDVALALGRYPRMFIASDGVYIGTGKDEKNIQWKIHKEMPFLNQMISWRTVWIRDAKERSCMKN